MTNDNPNKDSNLLSETNFQLPLAIELAVIVDSHLENFDFLLRSLKKQELNESLGLTTICKSEQKDEVNRLFRQIDLTRLFSQQIIVEDSGNFALRRNLVFQNTRARVVYFLDEKGQLLFSRHLSHLLTNMNSSKQKSIACSGSYQDGSKVNALGSAANLLSSVGLLKKNPSHLISGNLIVKFDSPERLQKAQIAQKQAADIQEAFFFHHLQKEGFSLLRNEDFSLGRNSVLNWPLFKKECSSLRVRHLANGVSTLSAIGWIFRSKSPLGAKLLASFTLLIGGF